MKLIGRSEWGQKVGKLANFAASGGRPETAVWKKRGGGEGAGGMGEGLLGRREGLHQRATDDGAGGTTASGSGTASENGRRAGGPTSENGISAPKKRALCPDICFGKSAA